MRLYTTFTVANEVVTRLIQRYLAFTPVEPGGLGCMNGSDENPTVSDSSWSEAVNTLHFLLKLVSDLCCLVVINKCFVQNPRKLESQAR